jgi:hypothetical protein
MNRFEHKLALSVTAVIALVFVAAGCGSDDDDGGPAFGPGPDLIVFTRLNLQPEGIEWDARRGRFLVGSLTDGTIRAVDDDGNLTVVTPDAGLSGSVGIHIDETRDRLFAAGNIQGVGIALGIYDLATGEQIRIVDLSELSGANGGLANDVVVDADGNAYVTDTTNAMVYRVDVDGNASVLVEAPELRLANGIEIDNRTLIVAILTGPSLLRIPLDDVDALATIDSDVPVSGDGIVFTHDGILATVSGTSVLLLESDDGWLSASLIGQWDAGTVSAALPTTAAVRGGDVHVVFAHLFDDTNEDYEIAKVLFE